MPARHPLLRVVVIDGYTHRAAIATADPDAPHLPAQLRVDRAMADGDTARDREAEGWIYLHAPADGTPGLPVPTLGEAWAANLAHPFDDPLGVIAALLTIGTMPDAIGTATVAWDACAGLDLITEGSYV